MRDDEFYTPYHVVDRELSKHAADLTGRRVLADCNDMMDGRPGMFAQWLADHAGRLRLRSLTVAEYHETTLFDRRPGRIWEWDGDGWTPRVLDSDGGFDSPDVDRLRAGMDVVVTNPPFSRFGAWFARTLRAGVSYCALAPLTAVAYDGVFPEFMAGRCRAVDAGSVRYRRPDGSGRRLGQTCWLTNMDSGRTPWKPTGVRMGDRQWRRLDGTDIIDVPSSRLLPDDLEGVAAVPLSCVVGWDRSHPFRVVGSVSDPVIDGRTRFRRLLVSRVR